MAQAVTYCLKDGSGQTAGYYKDAGHVAALLTRQFEVRFLGLLTAYQQFIKKQHIENVRTKEEYGLEFLTFGVLDSVYGGKADKVSGFHEKLLGAAVWCRQHAHAMKPVYSYFKGRLIRSYLPDAAESIAIRKKETVIHHLKQLLMYLQASGEFHEEVKRLKHWYDFIQSRMDAEEIWQGCQKLTQYFKRVGGKYLGAYTEQVAAFRREEGWRHQGREDFMFVQRAEIEYHLNMAGAEILNAAFRKDFIKAEEKFIFVPACMVYQSGTKCQRTQGGKGALCRGCTAVCPVNRTVQLGKQQGYQTVIVAHGSQLYRAKAEGKKGAKGLIGIACPLNLLSGGWLAKDLGYIPQCVLLNECGCQEHWCQPRRVTQIDEQRLKEIMSAK